MMAKNNTRCAGRTRRIMLALCALTCAAAAVLASCGKKEDGDSIGADTSSAECDSMNGINESDADSSRVYNAAAINRLTGLPLDETSLHNHRPIAIMKKISMSPARRRESPRRRSCTSARSRAVLRE